MYRNSLDCELYKDISFRLNIPAKIMNNPREKYDGNELCSILYILNIHTLYSKNVEFLCWTIASGIDHTSEVTLSISISTKRER